MPRIPHAARALPLLTALAASPLALQAATPAAPATTQASGAAAPATAKTTAPAATAGQASTPTVQIQDAWVRGTTAQQRATGAFMQITSSTGARLVGVSTPVAGVAEVHEMAMHGDVMQMRPVPELPLPKGQPVTLKPGSFHVMLMDLKAPLSPDTPVPLTLTLVDPQGQRQTVTVQAVVRPLGR